MERVNVCLLLGALACLAALPQPADAADGHGHSETEKLMEHAAEHVCGIHHAEAFNETCFKAVVADYFGRFTWCASTYQACFVCNKSSLATLSHSLFGLSNTAGSVTAADLSKISVALLVLTHDVAEFCKTPTTVPARTYAQYWADMSGEAKFKADKADWLEHVFEDVGKKFDIAKSSKCVTHKTIIEESEAAKGSSDEVWAQRVSLFTALHVVSDHQLDGVCVTLPSANSITRSLLTALGLARDSTRIPESGVKKVMAALGIGNGTAAAGGDSHAGHNHRRKRSAVLHRVRRAAAIAETNVTQCLSADNIFAIYGVDDTAGASLADFSRLCPALLEQKMSGACTRPKPTTRVSDAQAYGFGTLAVLVISAGALTGAVFVPCVKKRNFDLIMLFAIALAIGTLLCDSFLHLIPEALGLHDHGSHSGGFEPPKEYFWKTFTLVCAIYVLYVVELLLTLWFSNKMGHGHSHGLAVEMTDFKGNGEVAAAGAAVDKEGPDSSQDPEGRGRSDSSAQLTPKKVKNSRITAVFVLGGDSIHNFADGLAIGAAFSGSLSGGLSTSIAILCHELPHEIGDLAVLLSSNMSIKKALLLNLLSAFSAFIGMFIGVPLGANVAARQWIFAVTAGIFIYIALSNMLHSIKTSCPGTKTATFFSQTGGFLCGIVIILIIGLFEAQIRV